MFFLYFFIFSFDFILGFFFIFYFFFIFSFDFIFAFFFIFLLFFHFSFIFFIFSCFAFFFIFSFFISFCHFSVFSSPWPAGDLAHNQTVSLLLARAMWDCPIPLVMTASSSQGTTGTSWRKTGRSECKSQFPPLLLAGTARGRVCDSVDVLTCLAQGFMVAEHVVALSVSHNGFVAR